MRRERGSVKRVRGEGGRVRGEGGRVRGVGRRVRGGRSLKPHLNWVLSGDETTRWID